MIRQPDQIIQRQSPGEFAELITFFRADQRIEIAPVFHLLRGLLHFRHQRALALPIICILFNLLADFPGVSCFHAVVAPTAPAAARAAPPYTLGPDRRAAVADGQPAPARTARLTPSLVVADFPAFVVVFPDGSRSLHPATPPGTLHGCQTGYF